MTLLPFIKFTKPIFCKRINKTANAKAIGIAILKSENFVLDVVEILFSTVSTTRQFLNTLDLDINDLLKARDVEKIRLVDVFTNRILQDEKTKQRYLELAGDAYKYYRAVLPEPKARVRLFEHLRLYFLG